MHRQLAVLAAMFVASAFALPRESNIQDQLTVRGRSNRDNRRCQAGNQH